MNATLPVELYERTIEGMEEGEEGWTVPWAMYVEHDGTLWLNGNYTIHSDPGGTVTTIVRRTGDGFEVDISKEKDRRYHKGACYVGGFTPMPVVSLIR